MAEVLGKRFVYNKEALKYFKEEFITDIVLIPNNKPSVNKILNIDIWAEVIDTSVVESDKGISNEGQVLTELKLIVDLEINSKIAYVGNDRFNSSNILSWKNIKTIYICLPKTINGKSTLDFINTKRINVLPQIEENLIRVLGSSAIQFSALLFVQANVY